MLYLHVFSSICSIFCVLFIGILIVTQLQIEKKMKIQEDVYGKFPTLNTTIQNPILHRFFRYLHFRQVSDHNVISWALKGEQEELRTQVREQRLREVARASTIFMFPLVFCLTRERFFCH